ncbi:MAG: MBOAT family protein [Bacteroidetes bacterium]|nr:MBOAT family protein [Bacteroidota bacterium]
MPLPGYIMLFSSLTFLYLFLPLVLLGNQLLKDKYKNNFLLLASWIFFAWSGVSYLVVLLGATVITYFSGILVSPGKERKSRVIILIISIIINLGTLVIFKYSNFLVTNFNLLLTGSSDHPVLIRKIIIPLGISFFTFSNISYLIDVHRGKTLPQRKFTDLALYIALFPKLSAGPIVRYHTMERSLAGRQQHIVNFYDGIKRFSLGLFKKIIIANQLALVADSVFSSPPGHLSAISAWLGIVVYSLQIYFDFSAYTDMAIGIGNMLGFRFTENFNFPYLSKNITEFWRRWHITLSTWFRDYLFLKLAYSASRRWKREKYFGLRADKWIYMYATLLTMCLCGIWHGANWTFLAWGAFHGLFMAFERLGLMKRLKRLPAAFSHIYFLLIITVSWVFFRSDSLPHAFQYLSAMAGFGTNGKGLYPFLEYLSPEFCLALGLAIPGSTPVFQQLYKTIYLSRKKLPVTGQLILRGSFGLFTLLFVIGSLFLSTLYLVPSSYNPFIYFKF